MNRRLPDSSGLTRIRRGAAGIFAAVALLLFVVGAGDENAQPQVEHEAIPRAYLIRISLPIIGGGDARIKQMVGDVLARLDEVDENGPRPVIVFEFWPSSGENTEGTEFERALSLARFLSSDELNRVRTVAYVPKSISGHAVLVAMACEEIIISPDAEFGDAGIDEEIIDATVRGGYTDIATRRRTMPAAVAVGMLDPAQAVYHVRLANGSEQFVLSNELDDADFVSRDTVVEAGDLLRLRGDAMERYRFATHLATDRNELARALDLPANSLEIDPSLGDAWKALRVELNGPITVSQTSRVQRLIEDGLRRDQANFVCIEIDSPGGAPEASIALANYLVSLENRNVRTVAYVPEQALADAALVALACDHVVMGEDARLGGPGLSNVGAQELELLKPTVRQIARDKSRTWSLIYAMFDPTLVVHRYSLNDSNVEEYFCAEELAEQVAPNEWQQGDAVTEDGSLFQATGADAEQFGMARYIVSNFAEFRQVYHLDDEIETLKPNWAHDLIEALSHPGLAAGLLFIGFFAMMGELASPGIGVSGFVSVVCFVLFFWSQFLHGTAGWLEVLLFITGLVFLAVEIFVVPGFGIFGVGGIGLCLLSLVLASQTFVIPKNDYQFGQLHHSLLIVGAACLGVVAGLFVLRRMLPHTPYFNRMMLAPPDASDLEEIRRRENLVDWNYLQGKRGTTTTRLTPAGKARFGDQLVDVISDGSLIAAGTDVTVLEVQGNHVLVAPVDEIA